MSEGACSSLSGGVGCSFSWCANTLALSHYDFFKMLINRVWRSVNKYRITHTRFIYHSHLWQSRRADRLILVSSWWLTQPHPKTVTAPFLRRTLTEDCYRTERGLRPTQTHLMHCPQSVWRDNIHSEYTHAHWFGMAWPHHCLEEVVLSARWLSVQ